MVNSAARSFLKCTLGRICTRTYVRTYPHMENSRIEVGRANLKIHSMWAKDIEFILQFRRTPKLRYQFGKNKNWTSKFPKIGELGPTWIISSYFIRAAQEVWTSNSHFRTPATCPKFDTIFKPSPMADKMLKFLSGIFLSSGLGASSNGFLGLSVCRSVCQKMLKKLSKTLNRRIKRYW